MSHMTGLKTKKTLGVKAKVRSILEHGLFYFLKTAEFLLNVMNQKIMIDYQNNRFFFLFSFVISFTGLCILQKFL